MEEFQDKKKNLGSQKEGIIQKIQEAQEEINRLQQQIKQFQANGTTIDEQVLKTQQEEEEMATKVQPLFEEYQRKYASDGRKIE